MPQPPATALASALALAAGGLPVFPCNPGKKPAIAKERGGNGFKDATTDPACIRRLWALAGSSAILIGTPTGEASGIDILDIDPRHGGDRWEVEQAGQLGATRVHQTGGGGRHWVYVHVEGVRNSHGKIAPGVDVRGEGGYIIMPPSPGYSIIRVASRRPGRRRSSRWSSGYPSQHSSGGHTPAPIPRWSPTNACADWWPSCSRTSATRRRDQCNTLLIQARTLGGYARLLPYSEAKLIGMLLSALPADDDPDPDNERQTALDGLRHGMRAPLFLMERPYPGSWAGQAQAAPSKQAEG